MSRTDSTNLRINSSAPNGASNLAIADPVSNGIDYDPKLPTYQVGSAEERLNIITDRVTFLRENLTPPEPLKSTARELLAPLRKVVESLDEVAKIHPFIAVAALAFKAILNLELTRRENDRRIAALFNQMGDMIAHLVDLGRVKSVRDEQRWISIIQKIKDDVSECGNAIDVYYKQRLVVKIVKSHSWQEKLEAFANTFSAHKQTLQLQLSITINVVASDTDANVRHIDSKIDDVINLLRQRPKTEEDIYTYIETQGGIEKIVADEEQFTSLLDQVKATKGRSGGDAYGDRYRTYGGYRDRDDYRDGYTRGEDRNPTAGASYLVSVRAALATPGIEQFIIENRSIWTMKLEDQTLKLETSIELNTQRVLLAVASRDGPYQSVLHPQVREVWKVEGWRGSTTGRQFIQGLSDYFTQLFMEYESTHFGALHPEAWTLKYFSHVYRSTLAETFDTDCSGFVSVQEANQFTRRIPNEHSLPVWVAIVTAGWMLETSQYKHRIMQLYNDLDQIRAELPYSHLHPNYVEVSAYVDAVGETIQDLFGNLQLPERRLKVAYMEEGLYACVSRGMRDREAVLEERLERAKWEVDGPAALVAIAGTSDPIEKYILPLLFVVLRRHTSILSVTSHRKVDKREVSDAWNTLDNIIAAIIDRVAFLHDCFQQYIGGPTEEGLLEHFACGLFSRVKPRIEETDADMPWETLAGQYSALPQSSQGTPFNISAAVSPASRQHARLSSPNGHGPNAPPYPSKPIKPLDPKCLKYLNYPCEDLPDKPPPFPNISRPRSPLSMPPPILSKVKAQGDFRPVSRPVPSGRYYRPASNDYYHDGAAPPEASGNTGIFPFFSALGYDPLPALVPGVDNAAESRDRDITSPSYTV